MRNLTLGSLFDGSGGFPLAGLLAGIVPIWSSEIEPFAIRVTEKRLPELETQLPRISEEDLQKKEALLQNYKSQERVVEHLSHMNPYENWTLYDPAEEAES